MFREKLARIFDENTDTFIFDSILIDYVRNTLIPNRKKIPSLFRFSPADYYNIRGLEKETLFLSPVGSMNDIFEGLSCTIDDDVLKKLEDLNDIAFLKSFSEDNHNLLLWAHYANNYSGMCVEYDFSELPDEYFYHLFPVVYSEKRMAYKNLTKYTIEELLDLKEMKKHKNCPNDTDNITDIMPLFLIKSAWWKYENEWRIIASFPQIYNTAEEIGDECSEYYNINSQIISVKNSIKAVYLGPKIDQGKKDHIHEICNRNSNKIPVYSSYLSKEKYELEFDIYHGKHFLSD